MIATPAHAKPGMKGKGLSTSRLPMPLNKRSMFRSDADAPAYAELGVEGRGLSTSRLLVLTPDTGRGLGYT